MNEMDLKKNDEFRKVVKKKQIYLFVCLFLGIATMVIFSIVFLKDLLHINDTIKGIYTGAGGGMAMASIVFLFKNRKALKDEEKLKRKRIEETDERNLKIQGKAKAISSLILFMALYVGIIVGGIWYPILSVVLVSYAVLFAIVNAISYFVLQKKM